jgi:hypothetical protein
LVGGDIRRRRGPRYRENTVLRAAPLIAPKNVVAPKNVALIGLPGF